MERQLKELQDTLANLKERSEGRKPLVVYRAPNADAEAVALFARARTGDPVARAKVAALIRDRGWADWLDPGVCEVVAPGVLTLDAAAREAEAVGFSDAAAREYVARGGPDAPRALKTAESVAAELGAAFAHLLGRGAKKRALESRRVAGRWGRHASSTGCTRTPEACVLARPGRYRLEPISARPLRTASMPTAADSPPKVPANDGSPLSLLTPALIG